MNRGEALAQVASYVAGLVQAGDLEGATGLSRRQQDAMSDADLQRLDWAWGEVVSRLHRMGTHPKD